MKGDKRELQQSRTEKQTGSRERAHENLLRTRHHNERDGLTKILLQEGSTNKMSWNGTSSKPLHSVVVDKASLLETRNSLFDQGIIGIHTTKNSTKKKEIQMRRKHKHS